MKLLVGLGNPGPEYCFTRHNAGFMVLDFLCHRHGGEVWTQKFQGLLSKVLIESERLVLLKPQTFMNLSGESVQKAVRFFKVAEQDLIVVYDDVDVPLGTVKLKMGGGAGGHNGMKSIMQQTGWGQFPRIKVGVGRPEGSQDTASWVLSKFREEELEVIREGVESVEDRLVSLIKFKGE